MELQCGWQFLVPESSDSNSGPLDIRVYLQYCHQVLLVWLQFPVGPRVSVDTLVAVSVTSCYFLGWGLALHLMDVWIILTFDLIFLISCITLCCSDRNFFLDDQFRCFVVSSDYLFV